MRPLMRAPTFICAFVLMASAVCTTNGQGAQSCPYPSGFSIIATCGPNPSPDSIPSPPGGFQMTTGDCANVMIAALAALYSYNDPTCHQANSNLATFRAAQLKYVKDATEVLPAEYKQRAEAYNFQATIYCDLGTNTLILAYRGSESLTQFNQNDVDDWYITNFLQHLGDRPVQYQAAADTAELIQQHFGEYEGTCGSGRPNFILAGHSKGGGQAQYAAVRRKQIAIVFNSDMVNPIIYSDWMLYPSVWIAPLIKYLRAYRSTLACSAGINSADVKTVIAYYQTGRIVDVRMVNDPLTKILFDVCHGNVPHAPINWLINRLSCSDSGHSIETVVHELKACAP